MATIWNFDPNYSLPNGNVIEKKSPNAFDKNVQGEGKTVFWTDFAPKQLKRGIFGM